MVKALNWDKINIKQSLCDYSDAYILVTGDVRGTNGECINVTFKSNSYKCIMQNSYKQWTYWYCWMYGHYNASVNMIQYSHNYSNKSGGLWQIKRDELPIDISRNPDDVTTNN